MRITAQHQTSTWFEYTHHKQYLATDYFMLISFHIQYIKELRRDENRTEKYI